MLYGFECIDDEREANEEKAETIIKLVETREHPPGRLQPPEQALNLVAPPVQIPVVVPWRDPTHLRWNYRLAPQVHHKPTGLVALVGPVHHREEHRVRISALPHMWGPIRDRKAPAESEEVTLR